MFNIVPSFIAGVLVSVASFYFTKFIFKRKFKDGLFTVMLFIMKFTVLGIIVYIVFRLNSNPIAFAIGFALSLIINIILELRVLNNE